MNIVVCDDELSFLHVMQGIIELWQKEHAPSLTVNIQGFTSTEESLYAVEKGMQIDILFLDIQIPNEMNGMSLAKTLRQKGNDIIIVFVTAFSEYVFDSFKVSALRYLRKPVLPESVFECLDTALTQWQHTSEMVLFVDERRMKVALPVKTITYAVSEGHHIIISKADGTSVRLRLTISGFFSRVKSNGFAQCHRSFVANLMYVRCLTSSEVTMAAGVVLPLGARYADSFTTALTQYYHGGHPL